MKNTIVFVTCYGVILTRSLIDHEKIFLKLIGQSLKSGLSRIFSIPLIGNILISAEKILLKFCYMRVFSIEYENVCVCVRVFDSM